MIRAPMRTHVPGYIGPLDRRGMGDAFCEFMGLDASECGGGALPPVIIPETSPPPFDPTFGGLLPPGGVAVPTGVVLPGVTPSSTPGGGSALTPQQIAAIIASGANATSSVLHSTQSPYVIPGTNLVYNPATGQVTSGAAVNTSAVSSAVTPTMMMIIILVIVLFAAGGRK